MILNADHSASLRFAPPGRKGLGSRAPPPPPAPVATTPVLDPSAYRSRAAIEYAEKKAEGQLGAARRTVVELDERENRGVSTEFYLSLHHVFSNGGADILSHCSVLYPSPQPPLPAVLSGATPSTPHRPRSIVVLVEIPTATADRSVRGRSQHCDGRIAQKTDAVGLAGFDPDDRAGGGRGWRTRGRVAWQHAGRSGRRRQARTGGRGGRRRLGGTRRGGKKVYRSASELAHDSQPACAWAVVRAPTDEMRCCFCQIRPPSDCVTRSSTFGRSSTTVCTVVSSIVRRTSSSRIALGWSRTITERIQEPDDEALDCTYVLDPSSCRTVQWPRNLTCDLCYLFKELIL